MTNGPQAVDVVEENVLVMRESEIGQGHSPITLPVERPEDQDSIGKNESNEDDQAGDARSNPLPCTEIGALPSTPLAPDVRKTSAPDQHALQAEQGDSDKSKRQGQRRSHPHLGRILAQRPY